MSGSRYVEVTIGSSRVSVRAAVCNDCGALVFMRSVHDAHHDGLPAPTEAATSEEGRADG